MIKKLRPWLKSSSALVVNLSAVHFAFVFITPNLTSTGFIDIGALTKNTLFGIVYLLISVGLERAIDYSFDSYCNIFI